jgi:probable phosphoglycerate mutase
MIVHGMTQESITKPAMRRRVFLARHGEVSYFDETGRPFRPDLVPLNDEGRSQAAAAAEILAAVSFDRVISSGLPRSDETARIIVAGRGLTIETNEALREIRPGRLAEIPAESIELAFVGAFADGIDRDSQFLGGESFGSLIDRVIRCWTELLSDPKIQQLLIVAHGGVNRALLCHCMGLGLSGFGALEQDAGCINIIDVGPTGRYIVRLLNHTPYNPNKMGLELTTMERLYSDYRSRLRGQLPPGLSDGLSGRSDIL